MQQRETLQKKESAVTYQRATWLALLAVVLALFVVAFVGLGYAVATIGVKIVDLAPPPSPASNLTAGASFGTWFIDSTNISIPLVSGDKVPYVVPEAVQGIVALANYSFRLTSGGYYMAQYQVVSQDAYYFGLFVNPDSDDETRRMVNGSSLKSDGQMEDVSVSPIQVTFSANANDVVAVIYMGSFAGEEAPATIGTGVIQGTTPTQQPQAFLQLLQLQ